MGFYGKMGASRASGIYKITNLYNGKIYIGQTQNLYERHKEHFSALYRGCHPNALMQEDWQKYSKYFRWEIVELCAENKLNEREKYWIDFYNSFSPNGYNIDWKPYKRKPKKPIYPHYKQHKYHRS